MEESNTLLESEGRGRRPVTMFMSALTWPVRWGWSRMAMAIAPRLMVGGVEIRFWTADGAQTEWGQRIGAALSLIEQGDQSRFAWLARNIGRIVVARGEIGYFDPTIRGCVIGTSYLERCTPEQLGLVLMHEATHSRIYRSGIRTTARAEARIEAICLAAERDLARYLIDSEGLLEWVRIKSERAWWSGAEKRKRMAQVLENYD